MDGEQKQQRPEKGKQKASSEAQPPDSLSSRVAASASGLVRDAFSASNGHTASQTLAATLAASDKAEAAAVRAPAWADQTATFSPSSSSARATSNGEVSFRTISRDEQARADAQAQFDLFSAGGPPPPPHLILQYEADKQRRIEIARAAWDAGQRATTDADLPATPPQLGDPEYSTTWAAEFTQSFHDKPRGPSGAFQQAELLDGVDVTALLDQPNRAEIEDDLPDPDFNSPEDSEQDLGFSLPTVPSGSSFQPEISQIQPSLAPKEDDGMEEIFDRQTFLRTWERVLNNYTDDVWGDSLPQVQQARAEIRNLDADKSASAADGNGDDDGQSAETHSVRRLQQILRHVKMPS